MVQTMYLLTKGLMFQVFFFIKSFKILCKNPFNLFLYSFYQITKMKIKSFECPKSIRNYEKNTWNISPLVNKSFVPSAQRTSVLYRRLSDFLFLSKTSQEGVKCTIAAKNLLSYYTYCALEHEI